MSGRVRVQRVAAYGVVTDSGGRLLLARLTARTPQPGSWTLPGGGVEHGEHPEAAMVREVHEETGLRVVAGDLLGVDSIRRTVAEGGRRDDYHSIRLVYRATVDDESAPLVHEPDGSTDLARWADPADLPGLPLVDLVRTGLRLAGLRSPGVSDQAHEVVAAAGARAAALAAGDAERLSDLLHEDFRWTSHRGASYDRAEYIRRNTGGGTVWRSQSLLDADVVVVDRTAVLRAEVTDVVLSDSGEPETFRMPMTQVWVRSGSGWRCLAGHTGPPST